MHRVFRLRVKHKTVYIYNTIIRLPWSRKIITTPRAIPICSAAVAYFTSTALLPLTRHSDPWTPVTGIPAPSSRSSLSGIERKVQSIKYFIFVIFYLKILYFSSANFHDSNDAFFKLKIYTGSSISMGPPNIFSRNAFSWGLTYKDMVKKYFVSRYFLLISRTFIGDVFHENAL